jgi:type IV pilus assembly protein PilC
MPIYAYKALDERNKTVRGQITAGNEIEVEARLKEIGLDLVTARQLKEGFKLNVGGVKNKDKIMLCIHLEQLDRAGVPILESLADVRDTTESAALKNMLSEIYEAVRGGKMLSEAMAMFPRTFDSVFTGLVAAGEKTGNLHESFYNLAQHIKWNDDNRRKVIRAITYPIFTLFIMCISIGILMVKVVPQLKSFLESQGQEMPAHTKALIATSDFVANQWIWIIVVPVVIGIIIKTLNRVSYPFSYAWDSMMLGLPILGPAIRKINMSRFTHFFGVLYTSGIDILESIKTGQQVVKNKVISSALELVRKIVSEGNSLTGALRATEQFPSLVVRMFKVGEDSGNMKQALENINFFYEREVNDTVDGLIATIKPLLTIVLACILVWIAAAMFGPLYSMIGQMNY